jgi:undecaprenyl-diphosphatase
LKFLIRRQRPEGEWGAIYRRTDPHSFPSGHAARATMLAVLVIGLGPAWLVPIMLVWAPLVTLSRVAMDLHYLSDALAGAVLGIAVGIAMVLLIQEEHGFLEQIPLFLSVLKAQPTSKHLDRTR